MNVGRQKGKILACRVSDEEAAIIEAEANETGMNMNKYLRYLLFGISRKNRDIIITNKLRDEIYELSSKLKMLSGKTYG